MVGNSKRNPRRGDRGGTRSNTLRYDEEREEGLGSGPTGVRGIEITKKRRNLMQETRNRQGRVFLVRGGELEEKEMK